MRVDLPAAQLLTSPAGLQLLAAVLGPDSPLGGGAERADPLARAEALRRLGHPPELVAVVLTQARLLTRLRQRWGSLPEGLLVTAEGAEQATRPGVAKHRADRYRDAGAGWCICSLRGWIYLRGE